MRRVQKIVTAFVVLAILLFGLIVFKAWGAEGDSAVQPPLLPTGGYDSGIYGKYK